ncbi:MAG TPA: DNA polymerase III subunit gamma/tau [Gammaproteobacteria bacterium]|nr:DNA polymerase III subunit gamma/tau [Gammaproteobacteria bacterium]
MSYQVLARKWRPRTFTELVGQEHVLKALINALDNDRLHHAFLFTGTRGVGKTTIARILAKSLNCEKGVSSTPCGECSACTEINEGRFVDLIEVDAASRTKVDETRELLENVQYAPTRGRYKVYLIDEVHMFSNHSFNALLKTLEEPPPHVKFLLATTDPQKLPVTILSRCLQFNLKRLPLEQIRGHLECVLGDEKIDFETAALTLISRAADGSMRDALSLLDQAIAYGSGKVNEPDVRAMLGTIEQDHVIDLLHLLTANDAPGLLARIGELAQHSPDFAGVLAELISTLHRIALAQTAPEAIDDGLGDREAIVALAQQITPEDVQLYYQIGLIGRRDLPLAPDARDGFEMVLLRMLAFRPTHASAAPAPATPAQTTTRPTPAPAFTGVAESAPPTTPTPPAAPPTSGTPDDWENMVAAMNLSGMLLQLATNCALTQRDGNNFQLSMSPNHKYLLSKSREEGLTKALSQHLGQSITLNIVLEGASTATPAERQQERVDARQSQAESTISNDATVQAIIEAFDGQVKPGSVQPLK